MESETLHVNLVTVRVVLVMSQLDADPQSFLLVIANRFTHTIAETHKDFPVVNRQGLYGS